MNHYQQNYQWVSKARARQMSNALTSGRCRWVSNVRSQQDGARWRINTLTCQMLSNDPHCVLPARLELDRWLALTNDQKACLRRINWLTKNCKPPLSMNERNLHCYNSTIACGNYAPISPTIWRSLNYSNMQDEIVWAEPRCRGEFQWLFLIIK